MSKKQAEWLPAGLQLSGRAASLVAKQRTEAEYTDRRGGNASNYKGAFGGSSGGSQRRDSGALVIGRTEKVHTTTRTITSSTGVAKKVTTTTRTITYTDGTIKTETEERTEEIPPHGGSADLRGAQLQLRFADLRLGAALADTRPGSGSASTGAQKSDTSQQFSRNALRAHNAYRSKHGAGPLVLAKDLSDYAQQWANELAKKCSMYHSNCTLNGSRIGENIASMWSPNGPDLLGEEATNLWYSEESKYNYKAAKFEMATGRGYMKRRCVVLTAGHFTQVVWKSTKEMGIGKAVAANGWAFVVASYRPAGNMMGAFTANVGAKQ